MATASADSNISLSDITECSICLETWKDPRSLSVCDHIFCLQCLKTFVQRLHEQRKDTRCPVCRKKFAIPEGGLDALPKNFNYQKLLVYAAQEFGNRVKECLVSVEGGIAKTEGYLGQLDKDRNQFLEIVSDKKKKLKEKQEEMINLIKSEHSQLWNELRQIKKKRLKEIIMREGEINTELLALKSFLRTSKEFLDNGSASDICRSTNDLLAQASVLLEPQTESTLTRNLDKIDIGFIPAMKPNVNGCEVRLVGLIRIIDVDEANSSSQNQKVVTLDQLFTILQIQVNEKDTKISSLEKDVNARDTKIFSLGKATKEKDTKISSLENDVKGKDTQISSLEKAATEKDTKISRLEENDKRQDTKISNLEKQVMEKGTKIPSLETQLEQVKEKYKKLNEAIEPVRSTLFLSKLPVVRSIPGAGKGTVFGIAVIGSKLFIARDETSVEVYNTENIAATPHLLKIRDAKLDYPQLAACSHYNCLYVCPSNFRMRESDIYRVELSNSSVSNWTVKGMTLNNGVSLTNDHNLLVTASSKRQVREYTTHGELIRKISLNRSIDGPSHCIQLSDGNYVISHEGSKQHRVCIVDSSGKIMKSYGGSPGLGLGQLCVPCQLSIDNYDYVFIADNFFRRIQLLSCSLTVLGEVQIPHVSGPIEHVSGLMQLRTHALHFDKINHRLYIGDNKSLLVVELSVD